MLSKRDIQYIRSLAVKKYRQKYHKYFAEGEKICHEIITQVPHQLEHLYCLEDFESVYHDFLEQENIQYTIVSPKELSQISQLKSPNMGLAVLNFPKQLDAINPDGSELVLYLDGIRDPGNLGSLLRTADWFGVDRIILSPECVDIFNPKVVQASMGSMWRIDFSIGELGQFLENTSLDYHIYLAEMNGQNAFKTSFQKPMILVLGNESRGITLDLNKYKIDSITIPRKGRLTESLNVAIAGSILISEICK
jgi:TrmH family RNA methyltransferase